MATNNTFTLEETNLIGFALEYLRWHSTLLSSDFATMHASILEKAMTMTQDLDNKATIG